jgi:hypothetical protein
LVSASATDRRQSTATQVATPNPSRTSPSAQTWLILATNTQSSNLNLINPVTKTSKTGVAVTRASGLSGIAEVTLDILAPSGAKKIYQVDFSGADVELGVDPNHHRSRDSERPRSPGRYIVPRLNLQKTIVIVVES